MGHRVLVRAARVGLHAEHGPMAGDEVEGGGGGGVGWGGDGGVTADLRAAVRGGTERQ